MSETVSIIGGSGALGFGLAARLARAGIPVVLAEPAGVRAEEAARRVTAAVPGASVDAADLASAATRADVLVLCVPFRVQSEVLTNLARHLRPGQLVVDASVPLAAAVSGRATRTIGVWQGSAAQQVDEMVPEGVRVVSALHTVSAALLGDLDHPLDEDVLVCGDRAEDKERAMALLERIDGLRCVDCGPLEAARLTEQLKPLLIGIDARYKTRAGLRITGLPARA